MTIKVLLLTPSPVFEAMCKLADGRKRSVKVNRDQLNLLVMDYQKMLNTLRGSSTFKVEHPQVKRQRPQLDTGG